MGIYVMLAVVVFMNAVIFPRSDEAVAVGQNLEKHREKRSYTCEPKDYYKGIDGLAQWCVEQCSLNNCPDVCVCSSA